MLGLQVGDFLDDRVRLRRQVTRVKGVKGAVLGLLKHRGKGDWRDIHYGSAFRKARKVLGCDWSPHDLRHWFATTALSNGLPLLDVSGWLGHKSIKETADTYGHLAPDSVLVWCWLRQRDPVSPQVGGATSYINKAWRVQSSLLDMSGVRMFRWSRRRSTTPITDDQEDCAHDQLPPPQLPGPRPPPHGPPRAVQGGPRGDRSGRRGRRGLRARRLGDRRQ
ncbi:tyrosine-type recombinase/integrase [Streptomyces sp. NPDC001135]